MSSAETKKLQELILAHKERLGPDLLILTHHYQRQEIVDLGDQRGDSLELSRVAASSEARYIVFCGVHFMAESAAILARPEQAVFIPDPEAGCPMAEMADIIQVHRAWSDVKSVMGDEPIIPVTYVNSDAELKAFCGEHGGATCTSSNAARVFQWAYGQAERLFFLPDQHLGQNTAHTLGLKGKIVWNPYKPMGGHTREEIKKARLILWPGFCHVHTFFTPQHIVAARKEYPGCSIIVHPECARTVVQAADASGSTSQIIRYTQEQPAGSTIIIGTEIHLVERLARDYEGQRKIVPLARSACPNMQKITLEKLLRVLESLEQGPRTWKNQVTVPEEIREKAGLALGRMLELR